MTPTPEDNCCTHPTLKRAERGSSWRKGVQLEPLSRMMCGCQVVVDATTVLGVIKPSYMIVTVLTPFPPALLGSVSWVGLGFNAKDMRDVTHSVLARLGNYAKPF